MSTIFPTHWNLSYYSFSELCRRTTRHIVDVLDHTQTDDHDTTAHVTIILKASNSVMKFEADMSTTLSIQYSIIESELLIDKEVNFATPLSITKAFDNYLGPYVQLERLGLEDLIRCLMKEVERLRGEEASNPDNFILHSNDPHGSSEKMFEFIKSSLNRCTAFSTGNTYLSLSKEIHICLHHYAESLKLLLPNSAPVNGGLLIFRREEQEISRIVTTDEYCIDAVSQLKITIKKNISPSLSDEVDFSMAADAFMDFVSSSYSLLIACITERLESAMMTLRKKTNISSIEFVGDHSKYVKESTAVMNETIPRLRSSLSGFNF